MERINKRCNEVRRARMYSSDELGVDPRGCDDAQGMMTG